MLFKMHGLQVSGDMTVEAYYAKGQRKNYTHRDSRAEGSTKCNDKCHVCKKPGYCGRDCTLRKALGNS